MHSLFQSALGNSRMAITLLLVGPFTIQSVDSPRYVPYLKHDREAGAHRPQSLTNSNIIISASLALALWDPRSTFCYVSKPTMVLWKVIGVHPYVPKCPLHSPFTNISLNPGPGELSFMRREKQTECAWDELCWVWWPQKSVLHISLCLLSALAWHECHGRTIKFKTFRSRGSSSVFRYRDWQNKITVNRRALNSAIEEWVYIIYRSRYIVVGPVDN